MFEQFRGARIAAFIGLASLGLSACTMSDLAGLADALASGAGNPGYSGYGPGPVYAPATTNNNYYSVVTPAPAPSLSAMPRHAGIGAPARNPYAAPDRRDRRNRWNRDGR